MSEIIEKFNCLRKLNEEFKRNIKLFYVLNCHKINVLIVTNDDMVYALKDEENIEALLSLHRYEVKNKFIVRVVSSKSY
jgi:hypothetical protein